MNLFNSTNEPQLHDAAPFKETSEFERLTGINPNTRDMSNNTPLHNAKNLSSVQMLLQAGADIHVINDYDDDPLQSILESHHDISYSELFEIVRLFVDAGADVNWCNQRGWHRLWSIAFPRTAKAIKAIEVLLHFGADACKTLDDGNTALHGVAFMGGLEYEEKSHEETVRAIELLINAGADVHAKTINGQTPLHTAAGGDGASQSAVRTLLKYGADPNATMCDGTTPLMLAFEWRFPELHSVKPLLEKGANPLLADEKGMTAINVLYGLIDAEEVISKRKDDKHVGTEEYEKQLKRQKMMGECIRLLEEAAKNFVYRNQYSTL
jgi:ankyrin repeat protein